MKTQKKASLLFALLFVITSSFTWVNAATWPVRDNETIVSEYEFGGDEAGSLPDTSKPPDSREDTTEEGEESIKDGPLEESSEQNPPLDSKLEEETEVPEGNTALAGNDSNVEPATETIPQATEERAVEERGADKKPLADGALDSEMQDAKALTDSSMDEADLVAAVNAATEGDIVTLTGDVTLTAAVRITNSITIDGAGHTVYLADGVSARHFNAYPRNSAAEPYTVGFQNITIQGHGEAAGGGIGVTYSGKLNLVLNDVTLTGNINTSTYGGAVYCMPGNYNLSVELTDTTISGNAAAEGGGIYAAHGAVTMHSGNITNNRATGSGGGVYTCRFVMEGGTISGNTAATTGGGIYNNADNAVTNPLSITGGTISNNTASGAGGGIYANSTRGTISISGGTFTGNNGANGAAIGAITESDNAVLIENSTFTNNTSTAAGGGVYSQKPLTLRECSFTNNAALSGGAVFSYKNLDIEGGSITGNTSAGWGGGIYSITGNATVTGTTITGNTSLQDAGGGIYVDELELLTIVDVSFFGNSTPTGYYWELENPGQIADIAALHQSQVKVKSLTDPYTNAYNNRDVVFNWLPVTVTFEPNGGEWGDGGKDARDVETGVGMPAYQPDTIDNGGARFKGWFHDEELTEPFLPGTDAVAGDITVYAGWDYPLPVTFLQWDGSVYHSDSLFEGDQILPPATNPEREDYEFLRWSAQPAGAAWDFDTQMMPGEALTLYSVWDIDDFDVLYMVENTVYRLVLDVDYGTYLTPPEPPAKVGYTFMGWCSVGDGSDQWDFNLDTMPNGPLVLYACWELNLYDVIYMVDDKMHHTDTGIGYGSLLIAPKVPAKTGHTFQGWYQKDTPQGAVPFAMESAPQNAAPAATLLYWVFETGTMPDETLILYADFLEDDTVTTPTDPRIPSVDPNPTAPGGETIVTEVTDSGITTTISTAGGTVRVRVPSTGDSNHTASLLVAAVATATALVGLARRRKKVAPGK